MYFLRLQNSPLISAAPSSYVCLVWVSPDYCRGLETAVVPFRLDMQIATTRTNPICSVIISWVNLFISPKRGKTLVSRKARDCHERWPMPWPDVMAPGLGRKTLVTDDFPVLQHTDTHMHNGRARESGREKRGKRVSHSTKRTNNRYRYHNHFCLSRNSRESVTRAIAVGSVA